MSYVTNRNSRNTKRACTEKSSFRNVLLSTGGVATDSTAFKQGHTDGAVRKRESIVASIGGPNASGLNIIGGGALLDYRYPTNPDGHTIPMTILGEDPSTGLPLDKVASPPFPVSYQGPGYLQFINGFAVPTIIGNTEVKGTFAVTKDTEIKGALNVLGGATIVGDLNVTGEVTSSPPTVTFNPVITNDFGQTLAGVTTEANYIPGGSIDYFQLCIAWTGKGTLSDNQEVIIDGFPYTNYSPNSFAAVIPDNGVSTVNVGAQLVAQASGLGSFINMMESDTTSADPIRHVLGSEIQSSGSVCITGHLLRI